jgi:hypothetical protein
VRTKKAAYTCRMKSRVVGSIVFTWALGLAGCATTPTARPGAPAIAAARTDYGRWPDALRLQNEHVEAIVVPAIGRVMSFRFRDGENVFWEDAALAGGHGDPSGKEWINFGGDKTWPAPEAEWKNFTGRQNWMPPAGFDGRPATARIEGNSIVLTSAVDPSYGLRAVRRISLQPGEPVMTIATTYERLAGPPAKIGVWVITQFKNPVAAYVPVPPRSQFPRGYFAFRDTPWPQLTTAGDVIKVTRDPRANHKLGSDADRMLWVGEQAMCLVSTPRTAGAEYPDRGASVEIYTNSDPKAYVELETLGPLASLKSGDTLTQTNTYTLLRRTAGDPDAEARRVLK